MIGATLALMALCYHVIALKAGFDSWGERYFAVSIILGTAAVGFGIDSAACWVIWHIERMM